MEKRMNKNNLMIVADSLFEIANRIAKEDEKRGPRLDRRKRYKKCDIDKEESKEDCKDNFNDPDEKE